VLTLTANSQRLASSEGPRRRACRASLYVAAPAIRSGSTCSSARAATSGSTCVSNPPLKVTFGKAQAPRTIFAHEGASFKLTVQCRGGQSYTNYLLEEYLIYRAYNLLTDQAFACVSRG